MFGDLIGHSIESQVIRGPGLFGETVPGCEWKLMRGGSMDIATLAELLRETEHHHSQYEKTHGKHNWWDW
jgi:hypothetical protein